MKGLKIIPATRSDTHLIAAILSEATKHKLAHDDNAWGTEEFTAEEIEEQIAHSSTYLVYLYDELVGTVALQWADEQNWGPQPPDAGYMHRLAVRHGRHGQDIGKAIIEWARKEVTGKNRSFLRLDCDARNKSLCAYYEDQGFIRVSSKQLAHHGEYIAGLYQRSV